MKFHGSTQQVVSRVVEHGSNDVIHNQIASPRSRSCDAGPHIHWSIQQKKKQKKPSVKQIRDFTSLVKFHFLCTSNRLRADSSVNIHSGMKTVYFVCFSTMILGSCLTGLLFSLMKPQNLGYKQAVHRLPISVVFAAC